MQNDNVDLFLNRLKQSSEQLHNITERLDLTPPPTSLKDSVTKSNLAPNLERLILFLLDNQGARTDTISASIAIGNVSDTWRKKRAQRDLGNLGLKISCEELPACNRYGAATVIGHLFIEPTPDNEVWLKRSAANDS